MELKDIVHVSGKPGLFKIIAQGKTNLIVESLDAAKTRTSVSVTQRFSVLEDIAMFTTGDDIKLREVLVKLHDTVAAGTAVPAVKGSEEEMKAFFEKVLPEYDKERVHISDIKRLIQWYGLLKDILDFEAMRKAKDDEDSEGVKVEHHEKPTLNTKINQPVKVDTKAKNSSNKTSINRKSV